MKIRTETRSDISSIDTLTYNAFENHPHHEPGANPTEHQIINRLRDANVLTLSLVAEDETGIVGHVAFSPVTINGHKSNWYGLGPVSVSPERQNEGIGSQLIQTGLSLLKAQGIEGIVLLGEPDYYGRFGFQQHPNLTLPDVPPAFFLKLSLTDTTPTGEVAYHAAFYG